MRAVFCSTLLRTVLRYPVMFWAVVRKRGKTVLPESGDCVKFGMSVEGCHNRGSHANMM